MENMQCMNCGRTGHKFRNCPLPILSYGVACFILNKQLKEPKKDVDPDEWLCICIQRRHTYSYVDYLRGKYNLRDRKYLKSLLERMTQEEQYRISNKTFDTLWSELWLEDRFPQHSIISRKFKQNAIHKHREVLKTMFNHKKECVIPTIWKGAEWGLPKGRRNKNETNQEVSIREFKEETGIDHQKIKFISPRFMVENYVANNGHHYNNNYLIGVWNSPEQLDLQNVWEQNKDMYSFCAEISQIRAFTEKEIQQSIRGYEVWKKRLFETCFSIIKKYG